MQRHFRRALTIWIISLVWGLIFVGVLPDNLFGAEPLFRLSDEHGPAAIDVLGIIPAVIATAYFLWCIWLFRGELGRWDYVFVGAWAAAAIIAVLAARFNLTLLLIASSAFSAGSLLILGVRTTGILARFTRKR